MIHNKKNIKLYSRNTQKYSGNELLINEYINNTTKTKKHHNINHYIFKNNKHKYLAGGGNNTSLGRKIFGEKIETETINYERFDIANKEQFKQLKTNVSATRIAAFIARKKGAISKLQYELQMHLLKANLFFARMKLYNAKLIKIANILVFDENSIIKSIHSQINEIFELEKQINEGYISKKGTLKKLKPKKILKIIKRQDKIRYEIMKLTTFENSTKITKGCTSQGKAIFYNKNKVFICILGRYRKYESKFNKYYNKFKIALEGYFSVYPNCSGSIKNINLKALDITSKSNEEGLFLDETKCDTEKMYEMQAKSFAEVVKVSQTQLGKEYEEQTIGKAHKLSESYIKSSESLENTVNNFNTTLEQFKNFFKSLEFFGIHRYPGLLPRKKIAFQSLRGKKSYQLVNPKKLQELSQDKTFVQDFSEMIKKITKEAKDIFTPLDTEIIKIVPNIVVRQQITKPVVPPAPAPTIYNTLTDFGVISINMEKFDYAELSLKLLLSPIDTFDYPIIICVNNGSDEMVNRDSSFNKSFLANLYIPIAFSSYGNIKSKKYNIIFLRKDAIEDDANNPEYLQTLQPIDQSSRFLLNALPEGMTIENNQKSYAIANIIFNNTSNDKAGICIVCTELVGSNPDDLYHAKKIIDFNLRQKQINNILETVQKFNGAIPDLIVGDFGGCDSNIITQIINPTPAPPGGVASTETYSDYLWKYFQTNYPDFIPNFQNAKEFEAFFTNGFNLLTSYNADSYISTNPYTAPTTGPNYTKKTLQTLSNYIFYRNGISLSAKAKPNTSISLKNINNYGGNLPIYVFYDVSTNASQIIGKTPPLQSRIKSGEKNKLFTEKELQAILTAIDQLMSVFAYGKVPYIRRDLGCFSLRDDNLFGNKKIPKLFDKNFFGSGKSLLKASIQDIKYKNLDKVMSISENEQGINRLKTFYTMNFPAVIECFLFQKTGFFAKNPKEKDEIGYYSENQTVMTVDNEGKLETMPEFGNKLKMLNQEDLVNPDIAMRMFLIPSSHIKLIMDIDLRNQLTNQISAKDFKKLTKLGLQNFYGKYAINLLESRLSELLARTTQGDNNIVAHLLELTPEGNLKNLNNPASGEIILDLFEMIFIFLRMKFIDKQLELYDVEVKKLEKPLVEIEGVAKKYSKYKKEALDIYNNITDIISTYNNPLQILLYSEKVDRLSKLEYQLNPVIIPNSESLAELATSFSHKDIKYKPIKELEEGGISGLQYYEAYLSSLLGKRINKIAHVLKTQNITNATEYKEFFEKDLPANINELLEDARILHKSIQTTDISDVAIGNKIFERIKDIISKLKQLNEQWVSYFQNIITLLGYYYSAIQYLIIYENTIEDSTSSTPSINDLFKHDNILNEIEHIRDKVFKDTPERKSIITRIRNLPYKLSQDMEIVANQIQQIYDRIKSKLQSEVSFGLIHSLKSIDKYSSKQIFIQYPVSIYHVALRSTYLMFNKINKLFNPSDPSITFINYENIMQICDSIEISFSEIFKIRDKEMKTHLSTGKSMSINKNDIIYFENQEILTKLSRMIWAICNLLKNGEKSYDSVKVAVQGSGAVIDKIKITELFESIINSIKQFNDKLNIEVREICYYMMKPINLSVNLMYYITNVFTKNTKKNITEQELVITTKNKAGSVIPSLFNIYQNILSNESNEHLYKAIYSFRNNPDSNKKFYDEFRMIFKLYNNNKFNNVYEHNINLINNNNFNLDGEFSLSTNQLFITANNLYTDEIIDITANTTVTTTTTNSKANYNEFILKSISKLQKQDDTICSLIRDFQTNDDCSSENNSKRLEYEIKYKPSILYNNVGEIINIDASQTYNVNISNNVDNSMAYLFLDVLDYYKKNHDQIITDLTKLDNIINTAITASVNRPTVPQSFVDRFEKMLFKMNDDKGLSGNNYNLDNFCKNIRNIFTNDSDYLKNYLLYGDEVKIDIGNMTKFPRTEPLEPQIVNKTISGKDELGADYWNKIYDYNFMGILKRLSCVLKFYNIHDNNDVNNNVNNNTNLINIFIKKHNDNIPVAYQEWNEHKKNYIFNIQYFKDIYLSNDDYNNYINTDYLRNYFLKVIYQNCYLENLHNITKEDKIKFIINSIYTLSYLLNHDITRPNLKTENTLDFGFMILGISSFQNFMPSSYFAISNIINNVDEDKWLDSFVNKFFKEYLSYYCKKNDDIVNLNNNLIIDYVKSLAIYKANTFAKDVIDDTTINLYDNTYGFMKFINTIDLSTISIDNEEFKKIIKINYQIKKLEILIGTTTKGVLQDYLDKLSYEKTNNIEPVLHPYFIIDYLEEIDFYNIGNEIIKAIHDNKTELDKYKFNNIDIFNNYNQIELFKNLTNGKQYITTDATTGLKKISKDNVKNILLTSRPNTGIDDKYTNLTDCYGTDLIKIQLIGYLQVFVEKIIEIKELFMYLFFDKLFGKDKYYVKVLSTPSINYDILYENSGPLFHHNNMMKHLQDCIEFIITYIITNIDEINKNMDMLINNTKKTITMIFDIFRNELNNTIAYCFTYNDQNIVKNIIDNIKKLEANKNRPNYEWQPKTYTIPLGSVSSDKHIFDYIYTLLNGKDEKNNYYLISNLSIANKNIFEKYSKDAKNNDTEFDKFHNSIIDNGYLLNNVDINLNNEEIQLILNNTKKLVFQFEDTTSNLQIKYTETSNSQIIDIMKSEIIIKIKKEIKPSTQIVVVQADNNENRFEGSCKSFNVGNYDLEIHKITNIFGIFDGKPHDYNIYLADYITKDYNILFQYFMRKSSIKYFDYMINEFSNVNYNYIDKANAAGKNVNGGILDNPINHTTLGLSEEIKYKYKFIEKYDKIIEVLNYITKYANKILTTTETLSIMTDFKQEDTPSNIKNNINVIKNNYKILNDNKLFNIKDVNNVNNVTENQYNYLYYINNFCIKEQFNAIYDGIFNNFNADPTKKIIEIIDQHIVKNNVVNKIVKSIDKIYNDVGVKKINIKFTEIQGIITESNNKFNEIITNIRDIRDLFIKRKDVYNLEEIKKKAENIILDHIKLSKYPPNDSVLNKKILDEYDFVIDLLYGLEYGITELFSLVPYSLNNPYVDKSLNHRNNLFIATNVLGYMNTKLTDFCIKNNKYLTNKLDALLAVPSQSSKKLTDKKQLEDVKDNINLLEPFFYKNNIFKIEDVVNTDYQIPSTSATKIINFDNPLSGTKYPIEKQKRCKIWSNPLFNFNYGNGVSNFIDPNSRNIAKNIIMNFIKNNYYNESTTNFLTENINKAIKDNFIPKNEITEFTKNIKDGYSNKMVIYKQEISDAFKNVIKLIQDSNKENKDLLEKIITIKKYLQITPPQLQQANYRLELDNSVDTNKINQDMGILMNELINNFANLGRLRNFIIKYIIEIFKKYVIYQCMSGQYSISMKQFLKIVNDFNTSSTVENYNLSVYIYKFLMLLSENKNIDDLDNHKELFKYHSQIYNTPVATPVATHLTVSNNIKILTNKYDGTDLKTIQDLFAYTSVATNNDLYTEFGYINPVYFNIIMETYSKVLTLSQKTSKIAHSEIKYNHNHIINISNNNLIYLEFDKCLSLIMKIYAKYRSKAPHSNVILLDIIKEELLVNTYKANVINGIKYLNDFNTRIKEIFIEFNNIIKPAHNFLLEGGGGERTKQKHNKINDKHSIKLDYFILPNKEKKIIRKSNINNKRKKTKKHIISKNKKLTHNFQML